MIRSARAQRLDELSDRPKFRAVRHLTHNEPDHWILRPRVLESLAMLEERELILELPVVCPRHFDDVVSLAARFPRLRIVIDHLGKPPIGSAEMARWEGALDAAAACPNTFAKVSGLNTAHRPGRLDAERSAPGGRGCARLFWPGATDVRQRLAGTRCSTGTSTASGA